ncbi:1-phosphatidylinositol 4,5-bisphosphate phosphodiesterase delta-3-like isoform X2 [Hemitrygon akajei]
MQELKPSHQSEVMQRYAKEMPTSCCFAIVFKGRNENTDLVTLNGTEACHWIYVFTKLKKRDCSINRRVRLDQRRLWSVPGGTPQSEGATSLTAAPKSAPTLYGRAKVMCSNVAGKQGCNWLKSAAEDL